VAQEKEELQHKGDKLDADIRKAEKETRALENTVRLLNSRNQTYHRSLVRITDSSQSHFTLSLSLSLSLSALIVLSYSRRHGTLCVSMINSTHSSSSRCIYLAKRRTVAKLYDTINESLPVASSIRRRL